MPLTRRTALAGGISALMFGATPTRALSASRRLELYRGDDRIGEQSINVRRSGTEVGVDIVIDIDVRVIGLPVYRYALTAQERWSNGRLVSLQAQTDDNGTAHSVRATGSAGGVEVMGSGFSGIVAGNPATTSYWQPAFLQRPVWISTQDGQPLDVTARRAGEVAFPTAGGDTIPATRWQIAGGLSGLDLYYDRDGEWIGSEFEARGEIARFLTTGRGTALTPLWVNA